MTMLLSRADLIHAGYTRRSIQAAVRTGILLHVRRDCYLPGGTDDAIVRAVHVGLRLTCLSLLAAMGVFVLSGRRRLHVHVHPNSARLRDASDRRKPRDPDLWQRHRAALVASVRRRRRIQRGLARRCGRSRGAVSAASSGRRDTRQLAQQAAADARAGERGVRRPACALRSARAAAGGSHGSGTETLVRLMARSLGCEIRIQVVFEGIGRVDLLLDEAVVECDSREFHSD